MFSEESKRKLKEMDNIELYELSESDGTTECSVKMGQFTADVVGV